MKKLSAILIVLTLVSAAQATDLAVYTGTVNWGDGSTWSAGVPDAAGVTANCSVNLTATTILAMGGNNYHVGILNLGDNAGTAQIFTIGGGNQDGALLMNNNGNGAQINVLFGTNRNSNVIKSNITLQDDLTINAGAIGMTIKGGSMINGNNHNLTINGTTSNILVYIDGSMPSALNNVDIAGGQLQLSGNEDGTCLVANTVKIDANGKIALEDFNCIAPTTKFQMNGGQFNMGGQSSASYAGTLALTASSEIWLDGNMHFANSSAVPWTPGAVFTADSGMSGSLYFGTNANGLTAAQLAQITITGDPSGFTAAGLDATGKLIAVPEPMTLSLLVVGGVGALLRRRNA